MTNKLAENTLMDRPKTLIYLFIIFVSALSLTACIIVRPPKAQELRLLENPPIEVRKKRDTLAPLVLNWINETEAQFLSKGRPLTPDEMAVARELVVKHPERVRVLVLDEFPMPKNKTLYTEAVQFGLGSKFEGGRTMGYLILLKRKYANKRWILAHELVHVAQYERMGRKAFVRRYVLEIALLGSRRSPLELEAYKLMLKYR